MIVEFLEYFATDKVVLGIVSLTGILGFILTVFVSIRTNKISKILKYNQITSQYNKERLAFQKSFLGHSASITVDGNKTEKLLKEILAQVESYRIKFKYILSLREKITLFFFIRILKKEVRQVNWNSVCNYLAKLSGRLSKKEETKNG